MSKKLSKITFYEREKIELHLKMGKFHRWIGWKQCRNHSDITREINRNSGYFPYRAKDAQRIHETRQAKKNQMKLLPNLFKVVQLNLESSHG